MQPGAVTDAERRDPPAVLLLAVFTAVAIVLTFPNLSRFRTFIPGDSGDSLLNLWIMRAVQAGLPHGWHTFWNPPIFHPAADTLAYSETLFPVALVHWPLRLVIGDAAAFNLIGLGAWVLASWCTYRLARRVVVHWGAAFVAGLAYTYAGIRLVHQQHFQLVVGGALVPLVLLLLLRLLDAPTRRRGIEFGVAFATLTLTAAYYGGMMAVVVVIVTTGWLVTQPRSARRRFVGPLVTSVVVAGVLVAPFGIQYLRLQQHPEFRRGFDPAAATHVDDFLATGYDSYVLRHVPQIAPRSHSTSRGIENRLFPGLIAFGFGVAGAVIVAREIRRRGMREGRARELVLIGLAGAASLVLSFGDWFKLGHRRVFLPFAAFRHFVPGFAGVRAVSRLALAAELALALFAAVGVDALLAHGRGVVRVLLAAALAVLVCAEAALGLVSVRVPTSRDDGGVDVALRARPRGVVLELPIGSIARGAVWPYVESPRQYLAFRDGYPRVNGYSGFQPKAFDVETAKLNTFPTQQALIEARRLGVRYVVLRTALVGPLSPAVLTPAMTADRAGIYTDATARSMLDRLPAGAARAVVPLAGGYLVELGK